MTTGYEAWKAQHFEWRPERPADEAFCALVEREIADADRRAYECVGREHPSARVPEPVVRHRVHSDRATEWPRARVIAAFWRFEVLHGRPAKSADWKLRDGPEWPTFNDVGREFGSWTAGCVAAGYPASEVERLGL